LEERQVPLGETDFLGVETGFEKLPIGIGG
jgi:hypothetical protein